MKVKKMSGFGWWKEDLERAKKKEKKIQDEK